MKKYIKLVLLSVVGVITPFVLIYITIIFSSILTELGAIICYLYPIYLPIFCGFMGIEFYKTTKEIFLPTLIYNLFLGYSTYFLTDLIVESTGRDLGAVAVVLVLFIPTIYSVPISPIAAAIYKHKTKKQEQNSEEIEIQKPTDLE